MKFNINDSTLAKFYANADMLRTYIDNSAMLRTNFGFWATQFTVDPSITPTDSHGAATYTVESVLKELTPMADMRAPLGRPKALDKEGTAFRTGSIPHFIAPSYRENAFEAYYNREVESFYGADKQLLMQWTDDVQSKIDSLDQTLSNMAAQTLSTGQINYEYGRGIKGFVQDIVIPAENKVNAGEKVWTAADCKILTQMAKIEEDFRMRTGFEGAMKWQIPYDMFHNTFLTNGEVIEWVRTSKAVQGIVMPELTFITEDDAMEALNKYGKVSPIEIIVEKQKDLNKGTVKGWKDGVAVLRPVGYAGVIKHASNFDRLMHEAFGADNVTKLFSNVGNSGLYTLCNITRNNGDYKEFTTEVMGQFIPVLTEFPYHIIVNTQAADD